MIGGALPRLPLSARSRVVSSATGMCGRPPHRRVSGKSKDAEGGYGPADIAPRLSLVVLPFANLNNDPEQDYFADGITTDLTTDLAQMPGAFVIGRGTAFTYKNKQIDFRTLGKDLGVRWAVQGAVRRNGDQVESTFRLRIFRAAATSGRIVSMAIVPMSPPCTTRSRRGSPARSTLNSSRPKAVVAKWIDRRIQTPSTSLCAAGQSTMRRSRTETIVQAKELFDSALRLDPGNVEAMVGKA